MFDAAAMREIREEVRRFAAGFDADQLDGADAAKVVMDAAATINMLSAVRAAAAKRVADTHAYRGDGHRSAAHQLAQASGSSVGKAKAELETAERLAQLPATSAAVKDGSLSPEKAAAVADAATADPSAEKRLVEHAQRRSLGEVRQECAHVKAAADADPEGTHKRIHAARCARKRTCDDGSGEVTYRSTLEEVNEFWAVVTGFANRQFDLARLQGRREPEEAYAADGMLAMARAAAGTAVPEPESPVKERV